MDQRTELGEFLRTRRARLTPDEVGLTDYGTRRRNPGLRREEVAQLAGISVDYYVRLEQGRTPHVSEAVIHSVCRALRLSDDERAHLSNLVVSRRRKAPPAARQRVRPALLSMIECLDRAPAYILGRRMDVLAMNRMASLVFRGLAESAGGRANLPRYIFLDPSAPRLYLDWSVAARSAAAFLRMHGGRYPDDPELAALVGELSIKSEEFRQVWSEHPVADRSYGTKRLQHPLVGALTLSYETLRCSDEDVAVVVFHAPSEESRTALLLLASWGSSQPAGPN